MKPVIVAGNWKMNKTRAEVEDFFSHLSSRPSKRQRFILCPSPTLLESAVRLAIPCQVEIFSQNCFGETKGAFTGEISPAQLKELGVKGSLVGHSERRQFFGETNQSCLRRIVGLWQNNLEAIYCIGENLGERQSGATNSVLKTQLCEIIPEFKRQMEAGSFCKLILAYEPVWAIGTGLTANSAQILEAHKEIHSLFAASGIPQNQIPLILYGGSVKTSNFKEIIDLEHVNGGLVGGASLVASDFDLLASSTS
jgi:triosephosphate isomerase